MKLSSSSITALHEALCKVAELYSGEEDQLLSTDFYFMPSCEGYLSIFNDNDEEIARASVPEWKEYPSEDFYKMVEDELREAIKAVNGDGELERLAVWMPYSFVLVDDERESIAELLLVDEDTLLVTDSLLEGLSDDLNAFIENLLKE